MSSMTLARSSSFIDSNDSPLAIASRQSSDPPVHVTKINGNLQTSRDPSRNHGPSWRHGAVFSHPFPLFEVESARKRAMLRAAPRCDDGLCEGSIDSFAGVGSSVGQRRVLPPPISLTTPMWLSAACSMGQTPTTTIRTIGTPPPRHRRRAKLSVRRSSLYLHAKAGTPPSASRERSDHRGSVASRPPGRSPRRRGYRPVRPESPVSGWRS